MDDTSQEADICRVCRLEGMPERPLFHPCICTGSVKHIHQECLVQWLSYKGREVCELCNHRYSFTPVYTPDMPHRLSIKDFAAGITSRILTSMKYLFHYTLVLLAWLIIPPFTANWIQRSLFSGSFYDVMSTTYKDICNGYLILTFNVFTTSGLLLIRSQILLRDGPDWLEIDEPNNQQQLNVNLPPIPGEDPVEEDDEEIRQENENREIRDHWPSWEQLTGINGYLELLAHLFWVNVFNTVCIFFCIFSPYKIGYMAICALKLEEMVSAFQYEGVVATSYGYIIIFMCSSIMHTFMSILGYRRIKHYIGLIYIVIKVFLLFVVEFGIFPLMCGWWLDICSFSLFGTRFKDRLASFHLKPCSSLITHWSLGFVYVYCFVKFALILQEIIRPGIIRFLRNLTDPVPSIQILIQQNLFLHGRKIIELAIIFGTAIFLVVWLPMKTIRFIWPTFLPCHVTLPNSFDDYFSTPSLIIFGGLGLNMRFQNWVKMGLHFWCIFVFRLLGIKSYLLGDREQLTHGGQEGFQPYTRPTHFAIRLVVLLILVLLSVVIISMLIIIILVCLVRLAVSIWLSAKSNPLELSQSFNNYQWDFVTFCSFMFLVGAQSVCVLAIIMQERQNLLMFWLYYGSNAMVATFLLLVLIPFLFGLLHTIVAVLFFETTLCQTPVLNTLEVWATGSSIYMPIVFIIIAKSWNNFAIQGIHGDNIGVDPYLLIINIAIPLIETLSFYLAVPYVMAHSVIPMVINSQSLRLFIARIIYPIVVPIMVIALNKKVLVGQFIKLYENIKNDNYLVGRQLVNYNHAISVLGQN